MSAILAGLFSLRFSAAGRYVIVAAVAVLVVVACIMIGRRWGSTAEVARRAVETVRLVEAGNKAKWENINATRDLSRADRIKRMRRR
jgi:hypothetical protein